MQAWDNGLRFLIVDDTPTNRKVTQRLLINLGHSVEQAVDGLDFLKKINVDPNLSQQANDSNNVDEIVQFHEEDLFDVVLMDDNMPQMSGPDATQKAREHGYKGLIFGVTGNIYDSQINNFIEKGANEVFPKPLNIELLKEKTAKFLDLFILEEEQESNTI
jgi:CheY-like chemotaxis protein